MTAVSVVDVRDALNLGEADIADAKVIKMVKRAAVTLSLELSVEIDYLNCSEAQKEAITLLAAIYALCFLTGGSATGMSFSIGDFSSSSSTSTSASPALTVLQKEFERILASLKEPYVGSV
jgi:hypothetical protein